MHERPRGTNLLDSGAPFYDVYECAEGGYVSIAPIEAKFKVLLFEKLGIAPEWIGRSADPASWPELRELLAGRFRSRPRDHWCRSLEGGDACFAPVLSLDEAPRHAHQLARDAFIEVQGVRQPAPAPASAARPVS